MYAWCFVYSYILVVAPSTNHIMHVHNASMHLQSNQYIGESFLYMCTFNLYFEVT